MTPDLNVLISSAGRRVGLLRAFKRSLQKLGLRGSVHAADMSPLSSTMQIADKGHVVPRCTSSEFIPAMLDICGREGIRLLIPTIDTELSAYAGSGEVFESAGTVVGISSPGAVSICEDKHRTHAWLIEEGFPTIRQVTPDQVVSTPEPWCFPLIAKPAAGSASIGLVLVDSAEELKRVAGGRDYVVQEIAPGREYTLDIFVDRSGRALCAVPRKRLEVRGGEVSKGITVRHESLQALGLAVCERLPGAKGVITVQIFFDQETGRHSVIEINPRFGGGFPLAYEAGADYPRWLMEEVLGNPLTERAMSWKHGLVMLRYDEAVFVTADKVGL